MTDKEKLDKIAKYVKENFKPRDLDKDSSWSMGNYDDVFTDGCDNGAAYELSVIKSILDGE